MPPFQGIKRGELTGVGQSANQQDSSETSA
jgi:hypothetical protein